MSYQLDSRSRAAMTARLIKPLKVHLAFIVQAANTITSQAVSPGNMHFMHAEGFGDSRDMRSQILDLN